MVFTCPRCGYETNFITPYKKHINSKTICEPKVNDVSIEFMKEDFKKQSTFECSTCNTKFSSELALNKHITALHNQETIEETIEERVKKLEEEIKLLKGTKVNTTNTNSNNTTNNIVILSVYPTILVNEAEYESSRKKCIAYIIQDLDDSSLKDFIGKAGLDNITDQVAKQLDKIKQNYNIKFK